MAPHKSLGSCEEKRGVHDVNFTGHQNIFICEYCSLSGDNLHLWIIDKVGSSSGDNLHLWIIDTVSPSSI